MAGEYIHRTAVTRLRCSKRNRRVLLATLDEWRRGCQIATEAAWDDCYDKGELQARTYDRIRDCTKLKSQHVQLAIHRAAEAVKSCVKRRSNGHRVSKPRFTSPTVVYDRRTMTVRDDFTVTLATVESRVETELVLADSADGYQQRFLESDTWELTESTLHYRNGSFYLHLGLRRTADSGSKVTETGTVLGVDLGLENLAVTSTARFFSGNQLAHRRREFIRTRRGLLQNNSRSSSPTLRILDNREERHVNDVLHRAAKGVVEEALDHDCSVIAMEALDGVRERLPSGWLHFAWAFRRLQDYITYKAQDVGLRTRTVEAAYTSQRCADCGHTEEANRPSRSKFVCQACGKSTNADYNAAKNIAENCIRSDHQSSARMGVSRYALKSGFVVPGQGFVPAG